MKKHLTLFLIIIIAFVISACNNTNIFNSSPMKLNNEIENKKEDLHEALEVYASKTDVNADKKNKTTENTDTDKSANNTNNTSTTDEPSTNTPTNITLDDQKYGWGFRRGSNGSLPDPGNKYSTLISKYDGCYLGDTSKKVLYITFDNGYENGYTSKILDILKENNVKAAFFVTTSYAKENKDLIIRMVNEGHIVGNHSTTHPSMPSIQDFNKFKYELYTLAETYKNITGKDMKKFFRPPMGEFSERSMYYTKQLGYKSIFWSFAYNDWDPNNQPSTDAAIKTIKDNMHNGEIFLLHAVSKTNTDILDQMIKYWKNQGYEIKTLDNL